MTIRVLVADDHPVVRAGICNELARHSDIEVVGEAMNGDEALRLTEGLHPDVLLLDIAMPGMKAIQVIRALRAQLASPHILILTAYGDLENVLGMLGAGATGYLLKDEDLAAIAEAVRAVAQGETWLSAAVAQSLVQHAIEKRDSPLPLSEREVEVLRLMAKGCSNAQVAETLAISEGTVKNHVTNIYDKLQVHTRAEAVAWAWGHGLVDKA